MSDDGRLTDREGAGLLIQGSQETGKGVRFLHLPPFRIEDEYEVNEKPVFACKGRRWLDPRRLMGETILSTDGSFYKVVGVDTFATLDALGHDFGLMVEKIHDTGPETKLVTEV